MLRAAFCLVLACFAAVGCGSTHPKPGALAGGGVPATPRAVTVGTGASYQPAAGAHQVSGLDCTTTSTPREGVHLELFATGHIVIVPAGIGIAAPLRRDGAYVRGGRCSYPLRTREPTGVIELARGTHATLGDLFAVWGRRLDAAHLLGFAGPVRAWVDGRRVAGDPRAIPLRRHAEIVLVSGPAVPVHATYRFAAGL